jgi:uncharacterized membrane protein SirB2
MPGYLELKTLHIASALLSAAGFLLRSYWMLRGSPLLRHRLTRVLPHLVDTVLLTTAVALSVILHQYPLVHAWLTAKVAALLAYIVLGAIALNYGRTPQVRRAALLGALLTLAYIFSVALSRNPAGFLRHLPGLAGA